MRKYWLIFALAFASQLIGAQTLPFLYTPTDARSAALGGAGVALNADAWAVDNNLAAAVLSSRHFALGATYQHWAPSPSADNRIALDGWYSKNRWAIGLSAKAMLAPDITQTTATGAPLEPFSPIDWTVALGGAWSPAPDFAISATGRFISSALDAGTHGMTGCADVAMVYAVRGFELGLSVNNLGGRIRYGDQDYALPALLRAGVSYTHPIVTVTAEADYLFQNILMACAGVEIHPVSAVALRAGYHYGPADRGVPSFGSCGLHLGIAGLGIDAFYLFGSPALSNSFGVGMSYSF